ncbi:MAG: hypothetical protein U9N49_04985 [Campylobacterota bacterium]|nr:hypothetical protein [Campylobacterota bacterium]
MLGRLFNKKPKPFIEELAKWLEGEYGVKAKKIKHKRTFKRWMMNKAARIEFMKFTLDDGRSGRAFYSPFIQVFLDIDAKGIKDDDLLMAYGGWLFLSSGLKDKFITKDFKSKKQRKEYLELKKLMGLEQVKVVEQYKIGHSEVFVIEGVLEGYKTRCAGNAEVDICFDEMTDYFHIPTVYFLLGEQLFRTDK